MPSYGFSMGNYTDYSEFLSDASDLWLIKVREIRVRICLAVLTVLLLPGAQQRWIWTVFLSRCSGRSLYS